jgi:hypothetical protein
MQDQFKRGSAFPIAGQAEAKPPEAAQGEINGIPIPQAAPARPRHDFDDPRVDARARLPIWFLHTREEFDAAMTQGRPVYVCSCGRKSFNRDWLCDPKEGTE